MDIVRHLVQLDSNTVLDTQRELAGENKILVDTAAGQEAEKMDQELKRKFK
jgi:hypothetical protein